MQLDTPLVAPPPHQGTAPIACYRQCRSCLDATAAEAQSAPLWRCRQSVGGSGRYGAAMTDADNDEEFEPLESVPDPVSINAHDPDVGGPSVVRLFFRAGSHDDWPGGGISDVLVIEGGERVSIGLVRREVQGQAADGTWYGVSLQMGGWASLDVVLSGPLGKRSLLDASTGELVPRVEHLSGDRSPGAGLGTPIWRWS
jgi:hypothetical protein